MNGSIFTIIVDIHVSNLKCLAPDVKTLFSLKNLGPWSDVFSNPYITADNGIVSYGDAAENCTVTIYDDIVLKNGMAVDAFDRFSLSVKGETLSPESDSLIEFYVVADDTGSTDNYSCTMVNGEVAADGGSGVYINTRFTVGHLGDDTWNKRHAQEV